MPTTLTIMATTADFFSENEPPFTEFMHQESFFGGEAALSVGVGYAVVLGFGLFFSIFTTCLVYINRYFGDMGDVTSEHFKYVVCWLFCVGYFVNGFLF